MKKRDLNIVKNYKRERFLCKLRLSEIGLNTPESKSTKKSIFIIKWCFKSLCECN